MNKMFTNLKYLLMQVLIASAFITSANAQDVGCGDDWFDSGGESGNYADDENTTTTFCPDNPGDVVTLTFNYVDIETSGFGTGIEAGCWDFIEIFDGSDTSAPSLGVYCGEESGDGGEPSVPESLLSVGDSFTATNDDGCLTVVFQSDGIINETGWEASVTCGPPPNCTAPEVSYENVRDCDDFSFTTTATIDVAAEPSGGIILFSAIAEGVQVGGGTLPNIAGQTLELGPFDLETDIEITTSYLGLSCPSTTVLFEGASDCPIPLTCGEVTNASYCYFADDTSSFHYQNDTDEPITIIINQGSFESGFDALLVYDGPDATGDLLFEGDGDLSGTVVQSTGGDIFLQIESDFIISCESGSEDELQYDVFCGDDVDIPGCTDPTALNFQPLATVDDGSCLFPAVNDEACGAVVLECNGTPLTGNFDQASISPEVALTGCGSTFNPPTGDLWFQFEADGTSTYLISAEEGPDMVVALFEGDDCGNLTEIEACSDFPESFSGTYPEGTYYFLVRPWSGSDFNNEYEVSLTCVDGAPDNDEPCGATALECNGPEVPGTFLGATETISDDCAGTGTADIWFSFEADGETAYAVEETSFSNVVVSLYTAAECSDTLVEVEECSDFPENFSGVYSEGTYYVRVRQFSDAQTVTMSLSCATPPSNDDICSATPISCDEDLDGTTLGATFDDVGTCGTSNTAPGVWYEFTSTFDASVDFSTCNQADFDTKISVFTAADCSGSLTCIDGLDDTFPDCTGNTTLLSDIEAAAGQTLYVLIHGFSSAQGNFTLSVSCEEVVFDCPGLGNIGDPCDDGDPETNNDTVQDDCTCTGILGCLNDSQFPSLANDISDDGSDLVTISGCSFQTEYSQITGVPQGEDIEFTIVEGGYITVREGSFDGPVVAEGFSPVTVENASGADLFPHWTVDDNCVTQTSCVETTVQCATCPTDCPDGNIGDPCDDGDENTIEDTIQPDCTCEGIPPAPNDDVCDATELFCNDTIANQTLLTASASGPNNCNIGSDKDLWYKVAVDGVQEYRFDQIDTDGFFDAFIEVYQEGADCEDLISIIECQDFDDDFLDGVNLPAEEGVYYIRILAEFASDESDIFSVSLTCNTIDCPGLGDIGDPCDDGDPETNADTVQDDCTCSGVLGCVNDTQFPSVADDLSDAGSDLITISTCSFLSEYSQVTGVPAGEDIEFTIVEGGYITVREGSFNGPIVAEGFSPVTVENASGADLFPHWTVDDDCNTETSCVETTVQCTSCQADCPGLGNIGDPCDDGDDTTIGDVITDDCECEGTPTPASQCEDLTSSPNLAFGENPSSVTDVIEVSGTNGTLTDLDVVLVIDHVYTGDVEVTLTSPSGTTVDLIFDECTGGDNINVLLDDDGPALQCATGQDPVLFGTFAPEGSLADFNGEVFNGSWTLEVTDDFPSIDDGTLVSWCLNYELEAGGNEECENATSVAAQPEFAESEIDVSMADAVPSGTPQCINPDNPQSDMWFSFESVTTNMYVRAWGLNDFDAAVEVYDACGGELLNCQNDEPAGEREIVIIPGTTVGETYYFRVYHAGDDAPVEQDYTVAVAHIPFTQLSEDDCGVFDYTPADMITTDLPQNQFLLENWYFEFTELEEPFNTYEILSPNGANPNFMLEWFPQAEYGRTYSVRTRARMYQGPQWGDYGDACEIGFSATPLTTQLIEEQALGFYDMCDVLEADNVPGAEGYQWKFYDGFNVFIYNSPTRFCQLDLVEGLNLGSPYAVAVRAFTQGILAPQGTLRLIAMNNFVPTTQLDENITDCGATYPLNTVVSAVNICAAEYYTFKFTNISNPNQEDLFYTRDDGLRSISLDWVTGLNPGDTYAVQVLGASGGLVGEYGPSCNITIAGSAGSGSGIIAEGAEGMMSDIAIELYPNPSTGDEVMLNISNLNEEQQEVRVEVFDIYGKKVHDAILGNNGTQMLSVLKLKHLASGIYNVNVIVNDENVGAQKLVIQ